MALEIQGRERRKLRIRKKISGTPERLRLSVFRSAKHIYAQVVDDTKGATLAHASTLSKELDGKLVTQMGAESVTNPDSTARPEVVNFYRSSGFTSVSVQESSSRVPLGDHVMRWEADYQQLVTLLNTVAKDMRKGVTLTNCGFYGPQGRTVRIAPKDKKYIDELSAITLPGGRKFTNMEMETSAIYGMSKLFGHHALSCNAILANRVDGTFSKDPHGATDKLIRHVLERI